MGSGVNQLQAFSPSPTRMKFTPGPQGAPGFGPPFHQNGANGGAPSSMGNSNPMPGSGFGSNQNMQRSKSPGVYQPNGQGNASLNIPNGRFLDISETPSAQQYRVAASPSRSNNGPSPDGESHGIMDNRYGSVPENLQTSGSFDDDELSQLQNYPTGTSLESIIRRSPHPDNGGFDAGRRAWNMDTSRSQTPQSQGPTVLGGTPTRNAAGNGPRGVSNEKRFASNGVGSGVERPSSAMNTRSGVAGSSGAVVAGITDASGRMEGQALIDLIARVARTESALAEMSQQVASLNTIVKTLQISSMQNNSGTASALNSNPGSGGNSAANSGGSTPSVFGFNAKSATASVGQSAASAQTPGPGGQATDISLLSASTATPTVSKGDSPSDVAAITQQIAALSASVAQLQRMQSSSVRLGLEKKMGQSPSTTPDETANSAKEGSQNDQTSAQGGLDRQPPTPAQNAQSGYFPGPTPNAQRPPTMRNQTGPTGGAMNNSIASALGSIGSRPRPPPGIRSVSSNVIQNATAPGMPGYQNLPSIVTGQDRLGLPNNNGPPMSLAGMISPGPGSRVERDRLDAVTPGGLTREGGPGGMTVTKWEHLPLTPELQRQIVKYGIGPPNKIQARALPFMLRGSDIIAQAPPTQERIITYVIPVVQLVLSLGVQPQGSYKGPCAVIITTTVDQATQAHKLIRDIGAPLGVRTGLAVGISGADISADLRNWHQNAIHVLVGTPARLNDVLVKHANNGGLPGGEVRMLVLDEVDQLIARNLYENVASICRVLPNPRSRNPAANGTGVIGTPGPLQSPGLGMASPFDPGMNSPFNPASAMPFPSSASRGFNASTAPTTQPMALSTTPERQTCIFSNTIPTDVINFSQSIQVREPVRVLVRREGGANATNEAASSGNLRHYYLYLALAGGAGRGETSAAGPGTIGSGRAAGTQAPEVNQAKEFKLEALADLLLEYPLWQAIIHVGTQGTLDAVVNKLNSRQMENLSLAPDMTPQAKQAVYVNWRNSAQSGRGPRFLVVFDTVVKPPEVIASPLVVNFDLPRSVEGYAQRVSAAIQADGNRNDRNRNQPLPSSIILNFIQAAGGDVEMLRSTECAYRFKCSEIPASFRDLF